MNELLDEREAKLEVKRSDDTLQTWIEKPFISEVLRHELRQANVLLVPKKGYFTEPDILNFPENTEEFFRYLKTSSKDEVKVDICIDDDDFTTLIQHADIVTLASIVMTVVVAPICINIISDFILQSIRRNKDEARVRSEVTIYDPGSGKSYNYHYDGPASTYRKVMNEAIERIALESESEGIYLISDGNKRE